MERKVWRLVAELFLFFNKALYEIKASGQHLSLIYFGGPQFKHRIKNKNKFITFQTVDSEICSFLIFYIRVLE